MGSPRITTTIATSPVLSRPSIGHIQRTIESLRLVPELYSSPILIAFDAPRDGRVDAAYEGYKFNIWKFVQGRPNVDLMFAPEWGHLAGIMELVMERVTTPFVFVQQHDLPLIRAFQLDGILECLTRDERVKHVRLNTRNNEPIEWDNNPLFGEYKNPYVPLTTTGCWSDQSHFATAKYYHEVVIPETRGCKAFMEEVLNSRMKQSADLSAAHRRYGTFIYGAPHHPPTIQHTDARSTSISELVAEKHDAVSNTRNRCDDVPVPTIVQRSERSWDDLHRRVDNLQFGLKNLRRQMESLLSIHSLFRLRAPLPPMGGWAISPDCARIYIEHILEVRPRLIVELGTGVSTVLAGYCLERLGSGKIVAIDHDPRFSSASSRLLRLHGLEKLAAVRHLPLVNITIDQSQWRWYNPILFEDLGEIDLLLVDGPPQDENLRVLVRYPTIPVLLARLSEHAIILMDDAARESEKRAIERWTKEFPIQIAATYDTEKGTICLSKRKRGS